MLRGVRKKKKKKRRRRRRRRRREKGIYLRDEKREREIESKK